MANSEGKPAGKLERSLTLPELAFLGLGTILGAGIYVVIGKIAAKAGYWTPGAFLLAAVVASFTGAAYADLGSRFPTAGGPVTWMEKAFERRWLGHLAGWLLVVTGVVSAATITTGFVGYLALFFDLPGWLVIVLLLAGLGALAIAGIEESTWLVAATTIAGIGGLAFVAWAGFGNLGTLPDKLATSGSLADSATLVGLALGAFIAFYAFIGFEDLANVAEEVQRVRRTLPLAILISFVVSTLLYVLIAAVAVATVAPSALGESDAPLVAVVEAEGWWGMPLGVVSLLIIVNGALTQVIMASRLILDMGRQSGAPGFLARVNPKTRTPARATVAVVAVVIALALFVPLERLAQATSFVILIVFAGVNAAVIAVRRRHGRDPDSFGVWPWVPWIGMVLCLGLIAAQLASPASH